MSGLYESFVLDKLVTQHQLCSTIAKTHRQEDAGTNGLGKFSIKSILYQIS